MNKYIGRNSALKILSFLFAVLLWFYVITEQNPLVNKDIVVPVRLINIEALITYDMVLADDPNSFSITMRLKGKKDTLDKVNGNSVSAIADLRGYRSKGDNVVPLEINGIPQGIDVLSKSGDNIKVSLEPFITAQLPVTVNITGNPAQGMAALSALSNPTDVVIRGAESFINSVKTIVADIDIANANTEIKKKIPIKLLNSSGREVLNVDATPKIVEISVPVENIKRVPINIDLVGNADPGYVINEVLVSPTEIYITGKKEIIDSISFISTEKVDISNIQSSTAKAVKLILPEGVLLANPAEVITVNINIEKLIEKRININNIDLRNIPEALEVDPIGQNISVLIRGAESIINASPGNLIFYIDFKDTIEGNNTLSLYHEKIAGVEIIETIPYQFNILLKKKTQ